MCENTFSIILNINITFYEKGFNNQNYLKEPCDHIFDYCFFSCYS